MPNIATFYGINVFMPPEDHSPPHFHARYGEFNATFNLKGTLIRGKFPRKQLLLVKAWASVHEEDLVANWQLVELGLSPKPIRPLGL
jgi:hypothetical protein